MFPKKYIYNKKSGFVGLYKIPLYESNVSTPQSKLYIVFLVIDEFLEQVKIRDLSFGVVRTLLSSL